MIFAGEGLACGGACRPRRSIGNERANHWLEGGDRALHQWYLVELVADDLIDVTNEESPRGHHLGTHDAGNTKANLVNHDVRPFHMCAHLRRSDSRDAAVLNDALLVQRLTDLIHPVALEEC